ncbi:MAG: aminomethyl-transferring glycine dehydrogenase subunit GcvPA [Bacillota bacterium]
MSEKFVHPYIPNSDPKVQEEMLKDINARDIEALFACIPDDQRFKGSLDLPKPLLSEAALKKHVDGILAKNQTTSEYLSFLGGGCWNHHIPAICDEIANRSEFLTAYAGEPYEDHGRFQALFEYTSMIAELLDVDVVNVPTYDGSQASATALRMACRITNRPEVLIAGSTAPNRLSAILGYLYPDITVKHIDFDQASGLMNMDDLSDKISKETGAVYLENPAYLGYIETQVQAISDLAHENGALSVVWADPSSLGVLNPPSNYGADLTCGEIQPLGIHMAMGGNRGGFIGAPDEERFIQEYPSRLFGIAPTTHNEWGFGDVAWERTSFANRENPKEFVGTASALWGITAGVYLALLGPEGMHKLGENCLKRTAYALKKLSKLPGVKAPAIGSYFFKEFAVNFDGTNKSVQEINDQLMEKGIMGGHDLSQEYSQLGESALYSFTEIHSKEDIDCLVSALESVLNS